MPAIRLKRLVKKDSGRVVHELIDTLAIPVAITDESGTLLVGEQSDESAPKHPICLEEETIGWVIGEEKAAVIASLLSHLASREYEKKTLSAETLERYKEINLLYTISQKMASCLDSRGVSRLVIEEALKLINADSASVMLFDEKLKCLTIVEAFGTAWNSKLSMKPGEGIAGNVFVQGEGQIVNDVRSVPEFIEGDHPVSSLICIPLKVEEKILGVINISTEEPFQYTAGDLKLATTLATQAAVSIENARLHAEQLERERILKELDIARGIQQSMLPQSTPDFQGVDVDAMSLPAKVVGGDFYDFILTTDHRLGLVVADVSGKGTPAALFMALSRALMRSNALQDFTVSEAVIQTNRMILECTTSGLFVTLFYGLFDAQQHTFRYVCAGHNPPMLYRNATGEVLYLEADGIALGAIDDIDLEEKGVSLSPGDVIVLYTDGVTESINPGEEEFGEERLVEVLKRCHDLSATALIKKIEHAVMEFAENEPQFDDFTLMVAKIL